MALKLSAVQQSALKSSFKEPNIVLSIEGLGTIMGGSEVVKIVSVGDPFLEIGDPTIDEFGFYIGQYNKINDQKNIVTPNGTSTSIRQTLDIDKGKSSTISNLSVAVIDDGFATKLISPGVLLADILQRKCLVYYGFNNTSFPDDFSIIFRGRITDVQSDPGKVTFQISAPTDSTRTNIFKKVESKLTTNIDNLTTTIPVDDLTGFLSKILSPDGSYDPAFESYVRIDDEIIKYDHITAGALVGVVRAGLTSLAETHSSGTSVTAYYRLKENGVKLALKMMASGLVDPDTNTNLPYIDDARVTSVNVGGPDYQANGLFFRDINVADVYGVTIGDWVATSGAIHSANNTTKKQVLDIIHGDLGDFIVLSGVSFIDEAPGGSIIATFMSQYATLPDGCALGNDEIDIDEHLRIYRLFLSSVNYDFYIKEGIDDGKAFLEEQIYLPMASYSLPKKARNSIGYHIGPIPGADITTFDSSNIKNPNTIVVRRSMNKNFFNEILYQFDEDAVEDKFVSGILEISEDSKTRIKRSPNKTLIIQSKGLRTVDSGDDIARAQARQKLKRYQYGAESFTFKVLLQHGFKVEIGDIVVLDGTKLSLPDINNAIKGMKPRLVEIQDKQFQLKTGDIEFTAVDTNFNGAARYCLMSPSSIILTGISTTEFIIQPSFSKAFGSLEYKKWEQLVGCGLKIRNANFSIVHETTLRAASSNTLKVDALPSVPTAGMIMEFCDYDSALITDQQKLVYGFMSDTTFGDGKPQYAML